MRARSKITTHPFSLAVLFLLFFSSFNVSIDYYNQSFEEFFASGIADKALTLADTDPELLNATVFHAINKVRQQKGKALFQHSNELQKLAEDCMTKVENRKFTNGEAIRKKFLKYLLRDAKERGFKGTLVNLTALQTQAINYNNKQFFYNRKDLETELHLFYGERPTKQDKNQDREAIPYYTYKTFSDKLLSVLLKLDKENLSLNKAYKFNACILQWDYSSLYKNRIPQIKFMQIVGGYQTDLIKGNE